MSATNCCCTAKACAASGSMDDTRNRRPSGFVSQHDPMCPIYDFVSVCDHQPVGDRLVACAHARDKAAHADFPERCRQRAVLHVQQLEPLCRVGDFWPMRLPMSVAHPLPNSGSAHATCCRTARVVRRSGQCRSVVPDRCGVSSPTFEHARCASLPERGELTEV